MMSTKTSMMSGTTKRPGARDPLQLLQQQLATKSLSRRHPIQSLRRALQASFCHQRQAVWPDESVRQVCERAAYRFRDFLKRRTAHSAPQMRCAQRLCHFWRPCLCSVRFSFGHLGHFGRNCHFWSFWPAIPSQGGHAEKKPHLEVCFDQRDRATCVFRRN